jgi:hypothetical protein
VAGLRIFEFRQRRDCSVKFVATLVCLVGSLSLCLDIGGLQSKKPSVGQRFPSFVSLVRDR